MTADARTSPFSVAAAIALAAGLAPVSANAADPSAAACEIAFEVATIADHGALPSGTILKGEIDYAEGRRMRMGTETVSYLATGVMSLTAPDGTGLRADLRAIHMTRTPHFADYASFDAKNVDGDLGGVSAYEDPMLATLYAPRGSLQSFDLPRDTAGWDALNERRDFQVHTPDTMWTLPGRIIKFEARCEE